MKDRHTLLTRALFQSHPQFDSRILGNRRDVLVYLPPGSMANCDSAAAYPVPYLHDGPECVRRRDPYARESNGAWTKPPNGDCQGVDRADHYVAIRNTWRKIASTRRRSRAVQYPGVRWRNAQPRLVRRNTASSGRRAETVHRPEIPDAIRRGSTGLGGSSIGGLADPGLRALVPDVLPSARGAVARRLVG